MNSSETHMFGEILCIPRFHSFIKQILMRLRLFRKKKRGFIGIYLTLMATLNVLSDTISCFTMMRRLYRTQAVIKAERLFFSYPGADILPLTMLHTHVLWYVSTITPTTLNSKYVTLCQAANMKPLYNFTFPLYLSWTTDSGPEYKVHWNKWLTQKSFFLPPTIPRGRSLCVAQKFLISSGFQSIFDNQIN